LPRRLDRRKQYILIPGVYQRCARKKRLGFHLSLRERRLPISGGRSPTAHPYAPNALFIRKLLTPPPRGRLTHLWAYYALPTTGILFLRRAVFSYGVKRLLYSGPLEFRIVRIGHMRVRRVRHALVGRFMIYECRTGGTFAICSPSRALVKSGSFSDMADYFLNPSAVHRRARDGNPG